MQRPLPSQPVAVPWFQLPSGLWAPSTISDLVSGPAPYLPPGLSLGPDGLAVARTKHDADPLSGIYVFATEPALGIGATPWSVLSELVEGLPAQPALVVLSKIQAVLWRGATNQGLHLAIAAELFGTVKVTELLMRWVEAAPNHLIFTEQALVALQRMLIDQGGSGTELTEAEMFRLRRALLAMGNFVDAEARHLRQSSSAPSWLPYLTQVHAYFARDNVGSALGRSWQIFVRLAERLGPEQVPTHAPLSEWMSSYTGLSIKEQLGLGFSLFASSRILDDENPPEPVLSSELLDESIARMDPSEAQSHSARAPLVASRVELAKEIGDTSQAASHDLVPFLRHPFLRLATGQLLLLSPRALEGWLTTGLYYRLLDAAKEAEGLAGIKRFTAYVGHLVERYVLELVRSAHREPRLPESGRVLGELTYGASRAKTSDVAVVYPHEVVLLEVSSPRLTRPSRTEPDGNALRHDLWEIVGRRVGQLTQTIEAIKPSRPGEIPRAPLPGIDGRRVATFRPVIVTVEPVRMTPPMSDYLGEHYPGWPGRVDVEPLEIIDLESLEALLSLVEKGHSLTSLLARKQQRVGNGVDVGQWLRVEVGLPAVERPRYLNAALRDVLDQASEVLGIDCEDWPDDGVGELAA
jgi:hypothetical protein